MKELLAAIELQEKYNKMDLADCVMEFESYTGQNIPYEAIEKFSFSGLNNVDFFTSDFLTPYGIKNLYQFK